MKRANSVSELTRRNVETIARMERALSSQRSFGEWVADTFAAVVGSWTFLIGQSLVLAVWMALNLVAWFEHWDPYPFILLNLVLSFQAAYAGPIILMSQNRQGRLSERRNQLDLQINLLAEQETTVILRLLRKLCEKSGIDLSDEELAMAALEQPTHPQQVARQLEQADRKPAGRNPGG